VHVLGIEGQRRPRLDLGAGRELERRRHDADHREGDGIQLNGLADDVAIAAQHAGPEAVADDHDAVGAGDRFVRGKGAAEHRIALQHREQAGRGAQARHVLRIAGPLVREIDVAIRGERLQALRLALPVFEGRDRDGSLVALGIDLPQHGDLLGILVRQRVQHHRLDHAEDGGVGANAQGQGQHRHQNEGRLAAEGAEGVGKGGGPVGHVRIVTAGVLGPDPLFHQMVDWGQPL